MQKFLYVCASDIINEKDGTIYRKDTKPNCSECIKCVRTLCTLDVLGSLNSFSERFDLEKYTKIRKKSIINIITTYKFDHWSREIYELMQEMSYSIPLTYRLIALITKMKIGVAKVKIVRLVYKKIIRKVIS